MNKDINISKLAQEEKKSNKVSDKKEMDRRIATWQIFLLNNLNIFAKDILGIKLKFFQEQLLLEMFDSETFMFIGSRGIGKSFIVAVFVVCLCLLLPNFKIVICSMTIGQGNLIVEEKIKKLLSSNTGMSKVLNQLVKDGYIEFTKDRDTGGALVKFGNGSEILSAFIGESLRGKNTATLIGNN